MGSFNWSRLTEIPEEMIFSMPGLQWGLHHYMGLWPVLLCLLNMKSTQVVRCVLHICLWPSLEAQCVFSPYQ